MREVELWSRMNQALGPDYAPTWAGHVSLAELQGRTVAEALAAGVPHKKIWLAVWQQLELPMNQR
ncbi:MAG: DUF3046 domain-containing protein [Arachnia sp.]